VHKALRASTKPSEQIAEINLKFGVSAPNITNVPHEHDKTGYKRTHHGSRWGKHGSVWAPWTTPTEDTAVFAGEKGKLCSRSSRYSTRTTSAVKTIPDRKDRCSYARVSLRRFLAGNRSYWISRGSCFPPAEKWYGKRLWCFDTQYPEPALSLAFMSCDNTKPRLGRIPPRVSPRSFSRGQIKQKTLRRET